VLRPVEAIKRPPPVGLGVELSSTAQDELRQLILDYLATADMMVAENEADYPTLTGEVREKCPDVPMGAI